MRTNVTTEQVERYRADGFVVFEDFLDQDDLARWRASFDHAVASRQQAREASPAAGTQSGPNAEFYSRVFDQSVNLWQSDADVRALILDPRIGRMAAELAGLDQVRVWHDQALIKQAYGNPTAFHVDLPFWPFSTPDALSIWIALDDASEANGCLYFFPGSHRETDKSVVDIGPNVGAIFELYPQFSDRAAVSGAMKAGSCSFHNCRTIHGAGANMTHGTRRAMFCGFIPDGVGFDGTQHVVTDPQLPHLQPGGSLDDPDHHPIVFAAAGDAT